jgi:hypothetical protein
MVGLLSANGRYVPAGTAISASIYEVGFDGIVPVARRSRSQVLQRAGASEFFR